MHELKQVVEQGVSRGSASPLLPGGLPGPGGNILDELMVREATTRVSSVDTEDLAMLQRERDLKGLAVQRPAGSNRGEMKEQIPVDTESAIDSPLAEHAKRTAASMSAATADTVAVVGRHAVGRGLDTESMSGGGTGLGPDSSGHGSTGSYDGTDGSGFDSVGWKRGTGVGMDKDSKGVALSTVDLGDVLGKRQRFDGGDWDTQAHSWPEGSEEALRSSASSDSGLPSSDWNDANSAVRPSRKKPWWHFGFGKSDKSSSDQQGDAKAENVAAQDTASAAEDSSESVSGGYDSWIRWPWQESDATEQQDRDRDGAGSPVESDASQGSRSRTSESQSEDGERHADAAKQDSKPWWESLAGLVGRREEEKPSKSKAQESAKSRGASGARRNRRGQIETVVVSPDLPIAEIAAEIARVKVKQEQDADEKNRLAGEEMMQGPLAQLGRVSEQLMKLSKPELVLLCGLSGGVLVLLAVIAYRLELYVQYESIVKELVQ